MVRPAPPRAIAPAVAVACRRAAPMDSARATAANMTCAVPAAGGRAAAADSARAAAMGGAAATGSTRAQGSPRNRVMEDLPYRLVPRPGDQPYKLRRSRNGL